MDIDELTRSWAQAGTGPQYRRLADRVRHAIEAGDLPTGVRLPSDRDLAQTLGTSRTTVLGAYRLLRQEGLLEGKRGGGTRVAVRTSLGVGMPSFALTSQKPTGPVEAGMIDLSSSTIADGSVLPQLALSTDDIAALATSGYLPLGLPCLRTALAEHHASNGRRPTTAEEVLITSGGQQALTLLCTLLAGAGGVVATEATTYAGALDAIRAAGATPIGVSCDQEGLRPRALRETLERHPISFIYLMSTCHNPSGRTMGPIRRNQIIHIAREARVPVVDDTSMAHLARPHDVPATANSFSSDFDVTVGSLSKVFWPGLRIGWIRSSANLNARLARLKVTTDLGTSHPSQLLATRLLPHLDDVAAARRRQIDGRRAIVCEQLSTSLPGWTIESADTGMFVWVRLPDGNADTVTRLARAHGVAVTPGSRTTADGTFNDHLRISAGNTENELVEGIARLAQAWSTFHNLDETDRLLVDVPV